MIFDEGIQLISMLLNYSPISEDLTTVDHTKNGLKYQDCDPGSGPAYSSVHIPIFS